MFGADGISVGKGPVENPMATMMFKDSHVANAMLAGKLDAFQAVAEGDLVLKGMLPIIDNTGLILDRVGCISNRRTLG